MLQPKWVKLLVGFAVFVVAAIFIFSFLPPLPETSIDITTIHSQYIAMNMVDSQAGFADTTLFLTTPVQADTKNHRWHFQASVWKCMGLSEKDETAKQLRRGVVYKVTYQILGTGFMGEKKEPYIKMRCFSFEEVARTPQKEQ